MSLENFINADKISVEKDRRLSIEYVDINEINPNGYNPNSHSPDSFDLLIKSVAYFGFTQPIVVNRPTMTIVDGEHRFRVACVLGMSEVPVCYVHFDDEKLRYATIMHNRARGTENRDMLDRLYKELEKAHSNYKNVLLINR